jgi:hypothetical protein
LLQFIAPTCIAQKAWLARLWVFAMSEKAAQLLLSVALLLELPGSALGSNSDQYFLSSSARSLLANHFS